MYWSQAFLINTKNKRFDMSDLINEINKKKMKIGVFQY